MDTRRITRRAADELQRLNEIKTPFEVKLETTTSKTALKWIDEQNQQTLSLFQEDMDRFSKTISQLKSGIKFSGLEFDGEYIYKLQDNVWRKTTPAEFKKENPKWRIARDKNDESKEEPIAISDNDKYLSKEWHYELKHSPDEKRAIVQFTLPQTGVSVIREYDLTTKQFIKDGFSLPPKNIALVWYDNDSLLVKANFGNDSLTIYDGPRVIKLWRRGENIKDAKTIFVGEKKDASLNITSVTRSNKRYVIIRRAVIAQKNEFYLVNPDSSITRLPIPFSKKITCIHKNCFIFCIQQDWNASPNQFFKAGSLISLNLETLNDPAYTLIFEPTNSLAIENFSLRYNIFYLTLLNNVSSELHIGKYVEDKWVFSRLPLPEKGRIEIIDTAEKGCLISFENFLTPRTLYHYSHTSQELDLLKHWPTNFNAEIMTVSQLWAHSKDGTAVPYFIVHRNDMKYNSSNPTLLEGYGGFEHPQLPEYLDNIGKLWLEEGGVYVLGNIRGGTEFGPNWHQAANKEKRHKAFEDFIAIAEDLIRRKITSPPHLGIEGGSNGGLLVGVASTLRPDLFNAVICVSPLLNMLNFLNNFWGINWSDEYGNPNDPRIRDYLKGYSPHFNVSKYKKYPEILFMTSTDDTTVLPSDVRLMVHKMQSLGHRVHYYESGKGGHCIRDNWVNSSKADALKFAYLKKQLMDKPENLKTFTQPTFFPSKRGVKRTASEAELEIPQNRKRGR